MHHHWLALWYYMRAHYAKSFPGIYLGVTLAVHTMRCRDIHIQAASLATPTQWLRTLCSLRILWHDVVMLSMILLSKNDRVASSTNHFSVLIQVLVWMQSLEDTFPSHQPLLTSYPNFLLQRVFRYHFIEIAVCIIVYESHLSLQPYSQSYTHALPVGMIHIECIYINQKSLTDTPSAQRGRFKSAGC